MIKLLLTAFSLGLASLDLTGALVSHVPPILVLAFALTGESERVVSRTRAIWAKVDPWIVRLVPVVVLLVGVLFLLDALWWYATGEFFVPGWK